MHLIWPINAVIWPPLIVISALVMGVVAKRASVSTTWTMIAWACVLILPFVALLLVGSLLPPGTMAELFGEGLLLHFIIFLYFWPMTLFAAPVCIGTIVGGLVGRHLQTRIRLRHRSARWPPR